MPSSPEKKQYTVRLESDLATAAETAVLIDGTNMNQYIASLVLKDVRERMDDIQAALQERSLAIAELCQPKTEL